MILPPIGVLDVGRSSVRALGGFSFEIDTISEIFKSSGKIPLFRAQFVISQNGKASYAANSATIILEKSPGPKN